MTMGEERWRERREDTGWRRHIGCLGTRQQTGFRPGASRAPQGSDQRELPQIIAIPIPILFPTFWRSDVFRRQISNPTSQTSDLAKTGAERGDCDQQSVGALVRLLWHAAATGLKPLRLPRAQLQVIFRKRASDQVTYFQENEANLKAHVNYRVSKTHGKT